MKTSRTQGRGRHGAAGTREHHLWKALVQKCTNPSHPEYPKFGGRGIRVCDRWLTADGFENFLADLGHQPYRGAGLRLIDPAGHFEPGNVEWAPTRSKHVLTHAGRTLSVNDWAREQGVKPATLRARIRKGWPVDEVLGVIVGYRTQPRMDLSGFTLKQLLAILDARLGEDSAELAEELGGDEA